MKQEFHINHGATILAKLALQIDEESLNYKIKLNPNEALYFVTKGKSRCSVFNSDILELIKEIENLIPRRKYPGDNPNNGDFSYYYEIGREYSRVIYLHIQKDMMNMSNVTTEKHLQKIAKIANVNEFTFENGEVFYAARFWWD